MVPLDAWAKADGAMLTSARSAAAIAANFIFIVFAFLGLAPSISSRSRNGRSSPRGDHVFRNTCIKHDMRAACTSTIHEQKARCAHNNPAHSAPTYHTGRRTEFLRNALGAMPSW